jgi:excisionase family DNA binding protein
MSTHTHNDDSQRLAVPVSEVANMLGISTRHVWSLVARKELPAPIRLGRSARWNVDELRHWLSRGTAASVGQQSERQLPCFDNSTENG